MIYFQVKINLRWPMRLWCRFVGTHVPQPVIAGDAFSRGYTYCRRCGKGWRYHGWKKCWFNRQHRWQNDGGPSRTVEPGQPFETGVPFRRRQRCTRCNHVRVIDCATGEPIRR